MIAALSTPEIGVVLVSLTVVPLSIVAFVLWIRALLHCVRNRNISESSRIVWVVVICLTHFIGAVLYFLFGRGSPEPVTSARVG
jgi:hypothetical protein